VRDGKQPPMTVGAALAAAAGILSPAAIVAVFPRKVK
jgi:hypothetical protein